ncbi:DUF2254 family protein [Nocardioides sp.]|uniref:DUF2254 family protein n=1 Tax=Nocardioides sp. TaxID=35761 RepID=UPI0025CEC0CF|nr:DUF2254 family protein [Nocardioides sp.]
MRVRVPRALREFALVPILVVVVLLVLAGVSIVGDQAHGAFFASARRLLGHYIGASSATGTLTAVATGLVTVTSITFSVLLLAVQQTASSLSPVVFDQFVRRRTNQVYLGLFVGLALYSYVVMAAVQPKTPPIIGAFFATVLTVVALGCLLFLVYSTIDQMRPDNVMRQLHDRAVAAHEREGRIVARTRRTSTSTAPVNAELRADTFGYVESVDLDRIERAMGAGGGSGVADPGSRPEVEILVAIGDQVVLGALLARVRHPDRAEAQRICRELANALPVSPAPDIDFDPSTAVRDISNIGWTSGSTSKHNPAIAGQALHALRDLGARWLIEGERVGDESASVVYPDRDVETLLEAVYSAAVVARESRQHQQAVRVLQTYRFLAELASPPLVERIRRDVAALQDELDRLPASPAVDRERTCLDRALALDDLGAGPGTGRGARRATVS